MSPRARVLWRCFPWDPAAAAGRAFTPGFLPRQSGAGRFDLPAGGGASSWYFAETAEHAVAEKLQDLRNLRLERDDLFEGRHRLALVDIRISETVAAGVVDLCDPRELASLSVGPDQLAARDRERTQAVAARVHQQGRTGLRWWSALIGEWHAVVLFSDRIEPDDLAFGEPRHLALDDESLRLAAEVLGIRRAF